jgi:glycyl-tRNA synthetase beta chain
LKPTGNKDPFALRRNALGLARTIIESGFDLDVQDLIRNACGHVLDQVMHMERAERDQVSAHAESVGMLAARKGAGELRSIVPLGYEEIYPFIFDRLRGYYADKGVPSQHFNAVAEKRPASLYDFDRRIDAIGTFAQLPEAEALAAANKRIGNILKKSDVVVAETVDHDLLAEPAERALAESVEAVYAETGHALAHGDYVDALAHLARLRPQVDAFFEQVMVNVEDEKLRHNRLALLKRLADRLGSVAAIEHLSA